MARQNLESSLDAVENALSVLAGSLEQAGFAAGAEAYRQMADVIIGQRLWAAEQGITEYDDRYAEVGRLATKIYEYLIPYSEVASRLGTLGTLSSDADRQAAPEDEETQSGAAGGELGETILAVVRASERPISATRISAKVEASTSAVRMQLAALVERGDIEVERAGGRSLFKAG